MSESRRSVTAESLVRALKRRHTILPAEIGTFIILEACECALSRGPAQVSPASIHIEETGNVALGAAVPCDDEAAARALHRSLAALLVASGPSLSSGLLELVERGPAGGQFTLAGLRDDLEAALVPLNRTASRRVLARFARETQRVEPEAAAPEAQLAFRELDGELSALLEGEQPKPSAPPSPVASRAAEPGVAAPRASVAVDAPVPDARPDPAREDTERTVLDPAPSPVAAEALRSSAPPGKKPKSIDSIGVQALAEAEARKQRAGLWGWVGLLLLLLSVALVGSVWWLRPDLVARLRGRTQDAEVSSPPAARQRPPVGPKAGDIVVRVTNEHAQILRRVGAGPVVVPNLPRGVAHEFVALAPGHRPSRVVIEADAAWDETDAGMRFEVAMQLASESDEVAAQTLGPSQLPKSGLGSPRGLGSVRVVTTPRGAEVYQLVGFAPEARVSDLPRDAPQELLVYKPGFVAEKRSVRSEDYRERDGREVAELSVSLERSRP